MHIRIAAIAEKTIRYTCLADAWRRADRHGHDDDRLRQQAAGRADEGRRRFLPRSLAGSRSRPATTPRWRSPRTSRSARAVAHGRASGWRSFCAASTAATPSTRASSTRPASASTRCDFPADLSKLPLTTKAELIADQAAHPPWGTRAHRADRPLHALLPDLVDDRPPAALDRHERELAVDARLLEGGLSRRPRVEPGDRVFFPFSFGPFLGFWTGFEAGCQLGLHCVPGGGMSSQLRLTMIDAVGATVVCCTPTYALAWRKSPPRISPTAALGEQRPRADRRRRAGRQHPGDARAHRDSNGAPASSITTGRPKSGRSASSACKVPGSSI